MERTKEKSYVIEAGSYRECFNCHYFGTFDNIVKEFAADMEASDTWWEDAYVVEYDTGAIVCIMYNQITFLSFDF